MELYIWIAIGSALGGISRFWCSGFTANLVGQTFPWGTLVVNVVGLVVLRSGAQESLNVRGAYLEVLGDALGSVAVIASAVVIGEGP